FGHYLMSRRHGLKATLPYFIPVPAPFSPFGTMGAVINMREIPKNIRQLFDIGIAGPLSGLVVAIPVLFIGLLRSPLSTLPTASTTGDPLMIQLEGNSILYLLSKLLVFGKLLPQPASLGDTTPLLYWVKYFFTGMPIPYGGLDVTLDPVAWAGWGALLITGLNLIPVGQFDGGHILYALIGRKWMKRLFPIMLGITAFLGFFWNGWWLWTALLYFLGRRNAEPLDMITEIDGKRKVLGVIALIIFILIFIPIPLKAI
ncbi:MAG TPA: site-2 protease family protein, partial [Bellilinea sp.]|nr:site-2 protease family protein [Bellilinea sp.]